MPTLIVTFGHQALAKESAGDRYLMQDAGCAGSDCVVHAGHLWGREKVLGHTMSAPNATGSRTLGGKMVSVLPIVPQ